MPGIIYHLAFAEEVYRHIARKNLNKVEFLSGNLIPDLALDKKSSHFRVSASLPGCVVPDLAEARKLIKDENNSINLGMFCHLYLDYHFIETFLIPEFVWDYEKKEVINPKNGLHWAADDFFAKPSKGGILYRGYTEINKMMVKDGHIKKETLDSLPDILPNTNIPLFDTRRERTWRNELEEYLAEEVEYTGEIFDYPSLWKSIVKISEKFVEEETKK